MKKKINQKEIKLGIQYREQDIDSIRAIDDKKRTAELSFSSELPVDRWFGSEILDHNSKSVRLNRLNNGAALLLNHDRDQQPGVVESAEIGKDKRGKAIVRFGNSSLAEEIFRDVKEGIRRLVSFAYRVHEMVLEKESDNGDLYRVTDWEPLEISIVSVPADPSVGIGREESGEKQKVKLRGYNMNDEEKQELERLKAEKAEREAKEKREREAREAKEREIKENESIQAKIKDGMEANKRRVDEILAMAESDLFKAYNLLPEALEAIKNGTTVEDFRKIAIDKMDKGKGAAVNTKMGNLGLSENEIQKYSLFRAINALITKDWSQAEFERECSVNLRKKLNKEGPGFTIPQDILSARLDTLMSPKQRSEFARADLTTTTAAGLVATQHLASSFIDILRNKARVIALGAISLSGLVGNVSIPKRTAAATAYWIAEGGDTTESSPTIGSVTMSPKTVSARVDMTRRIQLQSNPAIEALTIMDIAEVIALAIDLAALHGSGAAGQPTGLAGQSGVGDVDGVGFDWAAAVELETDVRAANGDIGVMAYLTNATINGLLKTREKSAGYPVFLNQDGRMNGYPVDVSNQVAASTIFFGVWNQLIIGFWSGLDIKLDETTLGDSGGLVIRAFQDCDIAVRQAAAFSLSDEVD